MKFTEDPAVIKQWAPLVIVTQLKKLQRRVWKLVQTRFNHESVSKTLKPKPKFQTSTEVSGISQNDDKTWTAKI